MKKIIALLLAVAMILSVTACGSSAASAETAASAASAAASAADTATSSEGHANSLSVNLASEPDHLDPALSSSVDGGCLAVNSFEGLLRYNANNEVEPACAESYEVSDDGLTYTFHMRDGLKWSNGADLTAADFEYSWRRAADVNTAADYAYLYEVLADCQYDADGNFTGLGENSVIASEDGKTLTVNLNAPCTYFTGLCAFPTFFPVYQETVEACNTDGVSPGAWAADAGDNFVCNGAMVLSTWEHDSSMTYVKNEYYWDAANTTIDSINYMLSADETAIYTAYNTGDLDFIATVPLEEVPTLISSGNTEFVVGDYLGTYYVGWNYNSDLYASLGLDEDQAKIFRQAISLLIDRDYICSTVFPEGRISANTFIPAGCSDGNGGIFEEGTEGYFSLDDYEANVAEAKTLLASIGLWDEASESLTQPVTLQYLTNESDAHTATAECIQADLAQVGIEMNISVEEWNVFLDDRKNGNFDVAREGWVMDYNDPINMLEMWTTNSGNNDCQFGRDDSKALDWDSYDSLIDQIRTCTDAAERVTLMHQAEDMLMETWCVVPLNYYVDTYMLKSFVSGFYGTPLGMKYFYHCTIN